MLSEAQRVFEHMTNGTARYFVENSATLSRILLTALIGCVAAQAAAPNRAPAIDRLMTTLYERGQFNGAILVETRGDIIYRKGFGRADVKTAINFTPGTPCDVALSQAVHRHGNHDSRRAKATEL